MKLKIMFLYITLTFFMINTLAMDTPSEPKKGIHGIILKAEFPNGKTMCFVPSHHKTHLHKFDQTFQNEIFSKSTLVVEVYKDKDKNKRPNQHHILKKYGSEQFIQQIGGFVTEPQDRWSFKNFGKKYEESLETEFDKTFETVAETVNFELPHFYNIYRMKPDVMFALYSEIKSQPYDSINYTDSGSISITYTPEDYEVLQKCTSYYGNSTSHLTLIQIRGMDDAIINKFCADKKPIYAVETTKNVIDSLRLGTKKIDDIKDDIMDAIKTNETDTYFESLEHLHSSFRRSLKEKRLSDVISLGIRNKSWMPKYSEFLVDANDGVAVHGQAHFPGEEGIINLGQDQGWKWSLFQKDGTYLPFTYNSKADDAPFAYSPKT